MMKRNHSKYVTRTGLSLALCLVLFVSLFAVPAFAAGNTVVIIGEKIKPADAEPSGVVVVSGNGSGSVSTGSGSGIAADTPANNTQVIVGGPAANSQSAPSDAIVVQPDGTIIPVGNAAQNGQSAAEAAAPAAPVVTPATPTGLAAELFAKVNLARSENGLAALKYSSDLQSIANLRAQESTVSFGHDRPDGSHCSTAVTVDWNVTGENLIRVTSTHATADLMMETWMNSPSHRYNILHPSFTDIAVGVWETSDTTFVSLIFIG